MSNCDPDKIIEKIKQNPPQLLTREECLFVIETVQQIFVDEPNVLHLSDPIVVIGDLHGQLYDVFEIFRVEAPPPETHFLFLGDYVDRGYYSLEVLMLLLCLKIKYPQRIHMLRGNHESYTITKTYGFYEETKTKFHDTEIYTACCELFNFLPICALIGERIFGVHGGLSPCVHIIDQIDVANRFQEPIFDGSFSDLLWGDPNPHGNGFKASQRGLGYTYGEDVTKKFANMNRLVHIVRAHQLPAAGYDILFGGLLSTVWSAPNYTYREG